MDASTHARIIAALDEWIDVKVEQQSRSVATGRAQRGGRAAVTGGRHLAGVNDLVLDELENLGVGHFGFFMNSRAKLPGYYRAAKSWDLLVVKDGEPVLAVEYKSMTGSEGKNLNNRADEVIGVAEDLRAAQAHGLISPALRRAYIYLMEVSPEATRSIGVHVSAGTPDPVFVGASYLDRVGVMCERLRDAGLYDLSWAVGVTRNPTGFVEPNPAVNWDRFSTDLRSIFAGR